jgi:hypothetical protein
MLPNPFANGESAQKHYLLKNQYRLLPPCLLRRHRLLPPCLLRRHRLLPPCLLRRHRLLPPCPRLLHVK